MKRIDWNADAEGRIEVSDGVITNYVDEDQLPEEFTLREIAEQYASTYDHNGNDDGFVVAMITDTDDDEEIFFAFDGNGNFEWDTDRQFVNY